MSNGRSRLDLFERVGDIKGAVEPLEQSAHPTRYRRGDGRLRGAAGRAGSDQPAEAEKCLAGGPDRLGDGVRRRAGASGLQLLDSAPFPHRHPRLGSVARLRPQPGAGAVHASVLHPFHGPAAVPEVAAGPDGGAAGPGRARARSGWRTARISSPEGSGRARPAADDLRRLRLLLDRRRLAVRPGRDPAGHPRRDHGGRRRIDRRVGPDAGADRSEQRRQLPRS